MDKIRPHLWFDHQAREAAEYYVSTFPDSKITNSTTIPGTPSGDTEVISFELFGQRFMAISAGPLFTFTPAVSFFVSCETQAEVDEYWKRLGDGGMALMPLGSYPFNEHYGWTQDRYGLSWQIGLTGDGPIGRRITPSLLFVGDACGRAEEALRSYTSIFPGSEIGNLVRYQSGEEPEQDGTLKYGAFTLAGQTFGAMDSALAHDFTFNEAISLMVDCDTQEEIDRYWDALSAVPEAEQCGWLKDTCGVSWQIVPTAMDEMMRSGSAEQIARVTEVFLKMRKFDLAVLQRAYEGR
jgi:predicted 3-demethylubiquinone-9 3-methyltransferase (glyoxalase superfamily)